MDEHKPILRLPDEGRIVSLGAAGDVSLKVERRDSDGALSAYEFTVPPGMAGPPLHIHQTWDEFFYVLEGEMTFHLAGNVRLAPAGSCVFVPHGCAHTFWNAGTTPARQLTIFTPSGIEDYFDAVSSTLVQGGEESLEGAIELMRQHDMIVPEGDGPAYGSLSGR